MREKSEEIFWLSEMLNQDNSYRAQVKGQEAKDQKQQQHRSWRKAARVRSAPNSAASIRRSGDADDEEDSSRPTARKGARAPRRARDRNSPYALDSTDQLDVPKSPLQPVGAADEEEMEPDRKDKDYSSLDGRYEREQTELLEDCQPESSERTPKDKALARTKQTDHQDVNLSFCGCGFLGIYHVGVASCFSEYAPQLSKQKISGSSAGALVAVAHICGNLQVAYAITDILRVAIEARARSLGPFHPSFDINTTVREALKRGLPDDVHLRASGKLHVSLTSLPDYQNVVVSQFDSKDDVIQVLLCSCFIPFWSGLLPPKYKGVSYIDGGFSNNLLKLDDETVTVSPFAGEADICPQDYTSSLVQVSLSNTSFALTPDNLYRLKHALLPPPPEMLSDLCEQGFADGIKFLQRMKLINCTKCIEIRSSLLVTANGEDMDRAAELALQQEGMSDRQHHIRLERQEQKTIEISGNQRRNSVVSTTSQIYYRSQSSANSSSTTTTTTSTTTTTTKTTKTTTRGSTTSNSSSNSPLAKSAQLHHWAPTSSTSAASDHLLLMEDELEEFHCDECLLMRQKALCDPMPEQFSDRIRDACDTVNKSLSNWIYSHRPIKCLSYLAAPYYLPIDISLALVYKCWQQLPYLSSQVLQCVYNVIDFLIDIARRMELKSSSALLMTSASCPESFAGAESPILSITLSVSSVGRVYGGCYQHRLADESSEDPFARLEKDSHYQRLEHFPLREPDSLQANHSRLRLQTKQETEKF